MVKMRSSKAEFVGWILWIVTVFALVALAIKHTPKELRRTTIGHETTIVSVVVHDTVEFKKKVTDISVIRKQVMRDTVASVDSSVTDSSVQSDSATCYSVEDTTSRGTFIRAEFCSKIFPVVPPSDLTSSIKVKEAPDSVKEIFRTDTISKEVQAPVLRDWKTYGLVALGSAAVVAILILLFGK
jgi:hypothetical protein